MVSILGHHYDRPRFLPDSFTLALIGTLIVSSVLPCRGAVAVTVDHLTNLAIALLFFLHGTKLSRAAVIAAASHWRLHALVLLTTFVLFPLLGAFKPLLAPLVTPALYSGILFLCTLPSTVQSSIAFTSIAKGNVPAAICSASASSIIGIFVTPLAVSLMLSSHVKSASAWHTVGEIVLQLFVPFVCGRLLQPLIGGWIERHERIVNGVDQGSILLIVYSAFSEAVSEGLWHQVPLSALAGLLVADGILLAAALMITALVGKWAGFERADRVAIIFSGSKKSLSQGVTMAKVIFASHAVGAVILHSHAFPADPADGVRSAGATVGPPRRVSRPGFRGRDIPIRTLRGVPSEESRSAAKTLAIFGRAGAEPSQEAAMHGVRVCKAATRCHPCNGLSVSSSRRRAESMRAISTKSAGVIPASC